MNFELFVSLRYLLAKRRQTFISLITFISIAGVAVGVTALIVVLAVMNGFQDDLRSRILGITSHMVVGSFNGPFSDYQALMQDIEKEPGVVAATPFVYAQVMVSSGKSVSGAILRGIDPQTAAKVINIQENMLRGNLADLRSEPPSASGSSPQQGIILEIGRAHV
jgi:lipoprotein-releasing system permease protein